MVVANEYHEKVGINAVHKHNYRRLVDSISYRLYQLAQTICPGCTHLDNYTDLCSVFSFTYKSYFQKINSNKLILNTCPCSICLVKMNCNNICNEFSMFYINHKCKVTEKSYNMEHVKKALNLIVSINKANKRESNMKIEIDGLNMDKILSDETYNPFLY